jgi:sulfur-oxidizing protein SoxY
MPLSKITTTLARATALALFAIGVVHAQSNDPEENPTWQQLRKTVFQGRAINAKGNQVVKLSAPSRAEDAAVVPITIRTLMPQTPERYVRKMWLVIDNNPSPIGVIFNMTPESGQADIETRVRLENSAFVRVVAETNDGELFMDVKGVSGSGGCSAPGAKELDAASLGKMKIRLEDDAELNKPTLAKLMINHPNLSGLSRSDTRVQYVKRIIVSYAGREILSADVDFTISENPNFRFYFVPREKGELKAEVVDTNDLKFETSILVKTGS